MDVCTDHRSLASTEIRTDIRIIIRADICKVIHRSFVRTEFRTDLHMIVCTVDGSVVHKEVRMHRTVVLADHCSVVRTADVSTDDLPGVCTDNHTQWSVRTTVRTTSDRKVLTIRRFNMSWSAPSEAKVLNDNDK